MASHRSRRALALLLPLLCLTGCRKSDESGPTPRPIVPSSIGVNGCSAPAPALDAAPVAVPLTVYQPDPMGQVTAAADGTLYLTGAGGTVVSVDVGDPGTPLELMLVDANAIPALYAGLGISDPPAVSGLAVLDDATLLVVEHTANVILAVDRQAANQVSIFAGAPDTTPGFADATAELARFNFDAPCQLCPVDSTDGLEVYVADSGNQRLRLVSGPADGSPSVFTLAGTGFPLYADGDLADAIFDGPSGLSATCDDTLLLSEVGGHGYGQRIRSMSFVTSIFFGLDGTVETLVGEGLDETLGGSTAVSPSGTLARVSRPVSPLSTTTGEVYWVDAGTGVLRRLMDGEVDCPYQPACDGATADFTPGGLCSLTQTPDGTLYVLDAEAGTLYRLP